MAIKNIVVSDISGVEIPDDQHARVVIEHPDFGALELDVTTEEAEKFQSTSLRLVDITVFAPNVGPRQVTAETRTLDKLFNGVDIAEVLKQARKSERLGASRRVRTPSRAPAASREKIDYTAPDRYGQLHRGRVTEDEVRLVRANQEQASRNRQAQGRPAINWDDPKEKARYSL